jgi:hypothetical protein
MASAGSGFTVFWPPAPTKLPMTDVDGLKTFDAARAACPVG